MENDNLKKTDLPLFSLTVGQFCELSKQIISEAQKSAQPVQSSEQDEILFINQAAKFLNLAKPTLYGLTSKNEIPYIKKGKKLIFRRSELLKWLDEGRRKTNKEIQLEPSHLLPKKVRRAI